MKTAVANETVGEINKRARVALERLAVDNAPLQYALEKEASLVYRVIEDYIDTQVGASRDLIKSHLAATKKDVKVDEAAMKELLDDHTDFAMQAVHAAAHEAISAFVPGYRPPKHASVIAR